MFNDKLSKCGELLFYNNSMMLIIILLIFISLYLFLIYPGRSRKKQMLPYEKCYIAHRGLFNNFDVPENSLLAFRKAVADGYGIELDVQLTVDDKLVVFHDASLYRMTGVDKILTECSYEELKEYRLLQTNEMIPLFEDALKVLKPETPLIIEIKPEGRNIETVRRTVEMMRDYKGLYNMESFDQRIVRYLKDNEPQIIRGQLSYDSVSDKKAHHPFSIRFICTNLLTNFYNRPDYIAYDCNSYRNLSFQIVSRLFHTECVAWTVKSDKQFEQIRKYYDCFIFDSYIPKKEL